MPKDTQKTAEQWKQELTDTYQTLHFPAPNPNRPVHRNYGAAPWVDSIIERVAPHFRWVHKRLYTNNGLNTLPSAIDFGAGKGVFLDELKSRKLIRSGTGMDLIPGRSPWLVQSMWEPVEGRWDLALSTDALEHLPPELVTQTLRNIRASAPHGYLRACTRPDMGGRKMNPPRVLHLTLWTPEKWLEEMRAAGIEPRSYRVEVGEAIEVYY